MPLDYINLFQKHIPPIGSRYLKLFYKGKITSKLLQDIIIPSVHTGEAYRSISQYAATPRDDVIASILGEGVPLDEWHTLTYFTGSLAVDDDPGRAPKARTVMGDHVVFSFEYDRPEIAFLKEQLDWLMPTKAWEKSQMGQLFRRCSATWADFCGITVVWSGNKSLHIHVTFETETFGSRHKIQGFVHDALKAHWDILARVVHEILAPTPDATGEPTLPDRSLSIPSAFRRLPGGSRTLDKTNIVGMPAGTLVPQLVLWERFRDRAAKGVDALFFSPTC